MKTPGIEPRPIKQISGASGFNEVFLTNVRIPDSQRLGEVGEGWQVSMTTLMNERLASRPSPPDFSNVFAVAQAHRARERPGAAQRRDPRAARRLVRRDAGPEVHARAAPHRDLAGQAPGTRGLDPEADRRQQAAGDRVVRRRSPGVRRHPGRRGRSRGQRPVPAGLSRRARRPHRRRHRRDPAQHHRRARARPARRHPARPRQAVQRDSDRQGLTVGEPRRRHGRTPPHHRRIADRSADGPPRGRRPLLRAPRAHRRSSPAPLHRARERSPAASPSSRATVRWPGPRRSASATRRAACR